MDANVNYERYAEEDDDADNNNNNDGNKPPIADTIMPSLLLIHGSIILAQTLFGGGAIIGQLGLPATNPVLFALIREGIASPMLCAIAYIKDKRLPLLSDWKLFIGPGICLFLNQFCFIVGLKIASGITASAWQPSQGILAVIYGFCFGIEREFDKFKVCGILIGTAGALFMILYGDNHDTSGNKGVWSTFGGSIMFFLNCSATVMYLILGKPVFRKYGSSTITGYSYLVATLTMIVAAVVVANVPALLDGVCPDCDGEAWNVPTVTIYALIYWILGESIASYLLMTWANKYADPSVNLAYTVLQPLTSMVAAEILLIFLIIPKCDPNTSDNPSNCLYGVSWNDLGALGIVIGLYFVIYSSKLQKRKQQQLEEAQPGIQNVIDHDPSIGVVASPAIPS